jgi:CRP-like cAMP-binding protein
MISIMSPSIEPYLQGLRARQRYVENGRPLFRRGDPVTDVYYVVTGTVHLVRYQTDGSPLILQRAGPGSILAEASLYFDTYHCDAVACGDADSRAYTKASVKKLLLRSPEFSDIWANYLAQELQRTRLRAEILALRTVSERLDAWIAGNGSNFPHKGEWKLVAGQIGVSPEALYREIARRRDRKIPSRRAARRDDSTISS